MRIYGGQPVEMGNAQFFAGNPFGADFVIPQQRRQPPVGGPQLPGVPFIGNTAGLMAAQMPAGFQNKLVY